MPASFATLPSNVMNRILHLYRVPAEKSRDTVRLGCCLARVCSSLDLFGRSLVWCAPLLDYKILSPSKMAIFSTFERQQHLHPLVKALVITSRGEDSSFRDYGVSPIQVAHEMLKYCQALTSVVLDLPTYQAGPQTAQLLGLLSSLPSLDSAILTSCSIVLTPAAVRTLLIGFTRTTSLQLKLHLPSSLSSTDIKKIPAVKSPIRELGLNFEGDFERFPCLLDVLDNAFDKATIETVSTSIREPGWFLLLWMRELPSLRNVSITIDSEELVAGFKNIVNSVHFLSQVLTITINRRISNRSQLEDSLMSPIPISSLLSLIPSTLYVFLIKGIHFRGPLSYPQLRIKRSLLSQTEGPTVQCYFEESVSRQLVRLKKMRDSKGVLRWYQIIEVSLVLSP